MSKKFNYLELREKKHLFKTSCYQLDFRSPGIKPLRARRRKANRERLNFPSKNRLLPVKIHRFFARVGEVFLGNSESERFAFIRIDDERFILCEIAFRTFLEHSSFRKLSLFFLSFRILFLII